MSPKALIVPAAFGCTTGFVVPQPSLRGVPATGVQEAGLAPAAGEPAQSSTALSTAAKLAGAAI
eukprot:CAMPEP_0179125544 /NCGR_PEP_ID=MMETSP0796-20121207/59381_1 /TAXON_ID=73915 /ORGANISM="Pyrodinium bahamense, Strain pbaha01" /LENGTH=63 /DNA_ID=CAMNT_0020824251 /DNA_START=88 /DNA_END=276 /DNA_ORIENTATION=+